MIIPGHNMYILILSLFIWMICLDANICGFEPSDIFLDHNNQYNDLQNLKLLLIGGSDGSGTRGVVSLLERLGVPVIVDDPVSRDIHAAEIDGGWPSLITPLLFDAMKNRHHHHQDCLNISFPPKLNDLSSDVLKKSTLNLATLIRAAKFKVKRLGGQKAERGCV
jgi:hypothetical protein